MQCVKDVLRMIWAKTQLVYLHSKATGVRHALRRQVTSTQIAGSSTHGSCPGNATPGIFISVEVDPWMQQVKSCKQEESVHKYQDEDLHQPFGRRGCPTSCHSRLKNMVTPPWPLVNLWLLQPLSRHRHPPHLIHISIWSVLHRSQLSPEMSQKHKNHTILTNILGKIYHDLPAPLVLCLISSSITTSLQMSQKHKNLHTILTNALGNITYPFRTFSILADQFIVYNFSPDVTGT